YIFFIGYKIRFLPATKLISPLPYLTMNLTFASSAYYLINFKGALIPICLRTKLPYCFFSSDKNEILLEAEIPQFICCFGSQVLNN
ncbi:MAG: hypothetical protein LBF20_19515, partial [Paenibacillus polymyxa]|nr:hypothetical protein [Paenibacillus polymyxa]